MTTKKVSKNTNKIVIDKIKQDWFIRTYDDVLATPHVIIDNWYTEKELESIWHEIELYNDRKNYIVKQAHKTTDVAHNNSGKALSNAFRFYLNNFYTHEGFKLSTIHHCLYKQRSKEFKKIISTAMPLHAEHFCGTNTDSTMVSYYDTGKYYKSHTDAVQFTCLIWLFKEPKQFKGGDLKLVPAKQTIECVSNRMLFFPSYLNHQVTKVSSNKKIPFGQGRYCVTHFYNWQANNA